MNRPIGVGDAAPPFTVPSTRGDVSLADLLSKGKVVLVFYAEDDTPTCSTQVTSFRDEHETLVDLGAQVLGISTDGLDRHAAFDERLGGLPFPLAADSDLAIAAAYGVLDDTGKRSRRAVFVVEEDGRVALANGFYNPGNPAQFGEVFQALGLEF